MSTTLSISPTEYRSVRSSPSPSSVEERDRDRDRDPRDILRFQPSPSPSRGSPAFRQVDADRPYPVIESRTRELSTMGSLETLPEDTPQPLMSHNGHAGSPFFSSMPPPPGARERHSTPPVTTINGSSRSSSFNTVFNTTGAFTSSSPVSSSGSQFTPNIDNSLEAQLKALPLIHDILDRLVRCEYSTREIQRDLGDVHRKVNLLVERSLNSNGSNNMNHNSQPEFKDPFSPGVNPFAPPSVNGPRGSFSTNIAPNQAPPSDDIGQISQRLNTLTTSVGQLLALQTQQHIQTANAGLSNGHMMGNQNHPQQDLPPNQMLSPPMQNNMGHGLPNRPDMRGPPPPRTPNPPMRTWSAGTLDLPMRPSESGSLGRSNDILRDKRRSVVGGIPGGPLMRRESVGVCNAK